MTDRIGSIVAPRAVAAAGLLIALAVFVPPASGADRAFAAGSLIVPMDLAYQDTGTLQAYGLIFQLLRQGVEVYWVIDPDKTWHAQPCDTGGDTCPWDCAIEGSGDKCPYPTASPDFFAASQVLWDDAGGLPGQVIVNHGYRGGPFVVDAADSAAAEAIIDAWNDPTLWPSNPWATRTVFRVVSVHAATAPFVAPVYRRLIAPASLAVLASGTESIATSYLRAAGIPQSNGSEFPISNCGVGTCGPGTANPDVLPERSVMGELGTCEVPNQDHRNGALFTLAGAPAYCQLLIAHWDVAARETVECDDGVCPATQGQCAGQSITYNGHELVAEIRAFLDEPVHLIAQCQSVVALENTTPQPAWPFLDDSARDGHLLTIPGSPPLCPCTETGFSCVVGGCGGGTVDCCLPDDTKARGAGLVVTAQPASATLQVLRPAAAANQLDGRFMTTGGSDPSYALSDYLGTAYRHDRQVTLLTGPSGPGYQDVWMSGSLDGNGGGKVSYLGGHQYTTSVPLSSNGTSQGTRLLLNALFDSSCMSAEIFFSDFEIGDLFEWSDRMP